MRISNEQALQNHARTMYQIMNDSQRFGVSMGMVPGYVADQQPPYADSHEYVCALMQAHKDAQQAQWQLKRDGEVQFTSKQIGSAGHNECAKWLKKQVSYSAEWAVKNEGWHFVPIFRPVTNHRREPWEV